MRLNKKSFTLIELVITTSILAIVMTVIYSAFSAGTFGINDIQEKISAYRSGRAALDIISLDLKNSVMFSGSNSMFNGSQNELSFLVKDKQAKLARVSYAYSKGRLLRFQRNGKDSLNDSLKPKSKNVCNHVGKIKFEYAYFLKEPDASLQWQDSWSNVNSLPIAVKVNLALQYKTRYSFTGIIYLP